MSLTKARRLQYLGKHPELQSGRARSQSRAWTSSESRTDALLAYARTEEKEAEEKERVHDLLLQSACRRNEKGLPLRHFDVAQACIRASLHEEV